MDIYTKRSNWRLVLSVVAVIMLIVTVVYSNYLANQLEEAETKNVQIYQEAIIELADFGDLNKNVAFQQKIISLFPLPNIIQHENGELEGLNWGIKNDDNLSFLQKKVDNYEKEGGQLLVLPEEYPDNIYVFDSPNLTYIRYFPIVQIGLISLFVLLAYFLFNASQRSEQNRVWAGMAKETAHQLGTPISAILGWIEHLRLSSENNSDQLEIVEELSKDVNRLELVADRFSKIGSAPDLVKINIYEEMNKCKEYMMKRSPKRVQFEFPEATHEPKYVNINQHLFDWVVENLLRNALDSLDGEGKISSNITQEDSVIVIDISDTGKGIPSSKFNAVFKPGYSTKKRGWGLGLSLAKRIIENYHKGKIFVKTSKLNEGTTFSIRLPMA